MPVFPALSIVLPLVLVCTLAFTIETALGFGATLITVALGSLFLGIEPILHALVPLNLVLSGYLVVRNFKHVDRGFLFRRLLPFMALGLPIGIFVLAELDASILKRLFGAFLVGVSYLELWRMVQAASSTSDSQEAKQAPLGAWHERALLILGGAIHGAFTTGGPMAVYVTSRVIEDKKAYRATLSALWALLNLVVFGWYIASGEVHAETVGLTLALAPSIAIGMIVGEVLHVRVPVATFRKVVFGMLMLAGLMLLVRG
jgi:uncharacterized membrane protein YfcA